MGSPKHVHTHTRTHRVPEEKIDTHTLIPPWGENLLDTQKHTHNRRQRCRSINTHVQVSPLLSKERPINAHTPLYLYQSDAVCSHSLSLLALTLFNTLTPPWHSLSLSLSLSQQHTFLFSISSYLCLPFSVSGLYSFSSLGKSCWM